MKKIFLISIWISAWFCLNPVLAQEASYTLKDCINIGLDNNLPLKAEYARIKLTEMKVDEAVRNFFPQVSLRFSQSQGDLSNGEWESQKYGIDLQQTLFDGGLNHYTKQQAHETFLASTHAALKIEQDIARDVSKSYIKVLMAKETLREYVKQFKNLDEFYQNITQAYNQGLIAQIDFDGATHHYTKYKNQWQHARKELQLAWFDLKMAMGVDVSDQFEIDDLSSMAYLIDQNKMPGLKSLMQSAFENRYEIKEFKHKYKASEYNVQVNEANNAPRVDFVSSYGRAGEDFKRDGLDLQTEWMLGIQMQWKFGGHTLDYSFQEQKNSPQINSFESTRSSGHSVKLGLWDDLANLSEEQQARVLEHEAKAELDQSVKKIYREVLHSYVGLHKAQIEWTASLDEINFYESSHKIYQYQFKQQSISVADFIEQKIARINAHVNYQHQKGQMILALSNLSHVTSVHLDSDNQWGNNL